MLQQMQANAGGYNGHQIDFPDPFDPVALQQHDISFVWEKLATDVWQGVHSQAQTSQLGTIQTVTRVVVRVLSPTQIDQDAEFTVVVPANLATMMGMATTTCFVKTIVHHGYQGP